MARQRIRSNFKQPAQQQLLCIGKAVDVMGQMVGEKAKQRMWGEDSSLEANVFY
jgi:hypothetical protein